MSLLNRIQAKTQQEQEVPNEELKKPEDHPSVVKPEIKSLLLEQKTKENQQEKGRKQKEDKEQELKNILQKKIFQRRRMI
jgi:hypothetical protein